MTVFLVTNNTVNGNYGQLALFSDGAIEAETRNSGIYGYYKYTSSNPIILNTWSHVCWTQDGSGPKIYFNGVSQTLTDQATPHDLTTWFSYLSSINESDIGRFNRVSGDGDYFNGSLDDVRIYNRALSATEINQLYTVGR